MTHQPLSSTKAGRGANNPRSEVETFDVGLDVHRLDCAVDNLRGADLSDHQDELRRIAANLVDLLEPLQ